MAKVKIPNGCLGLGDTLLDFSIGGEVALPPLYMQDNKRIEYNQGNSLDCTLYSPIGQISDLYNYEFSKEDISTIVDKSYEMGRVKGKGRQTMLGVKCVCKRWNEVKNPNNKVIYYAIDLMSLNFEDALKKGYTVTCTYRGNMAYNNDFMTDGVLDGTSFGEPTYGHCIAQTARLELGQDGDIYVKDNYKGRSYYGKDRNYYKIKDLVSLVKNGVFYPKGYLIVPETIMSHTLEELKLFQEQKTLIQEIIAKNSALRYKFPGIKHVERDKLHENNDWYRMLLSEIEIEMKRI